jgi:hypothetical protein
MTGLSIFLSSIVTHSIFVEYIKPMFHEPPLKRISSEFSVGLSRSNSFANALNTLGPLCDTGHLAISAVKVSMAVLAVFIAWSWQNQKRTP